MLKKDRVLVPSYSRNFPNQRLTLRAHEASTTGLIYQEREIVYLTALVHLFCFGATLIDPLARARHATLI